MRFSRLLLAVALAPAAVVPSACSRFDGVSDGAEAGPLDGSNGEEGGAVDASAAADAADTGAARAKTLYVFGGVTIVDETEQTVVEAYAASIRDDGSLGAWERAPTLDVGRSYATIIAGPAGLLVMAGGNGLAIGQGGSGDFLFFRDDVSMAGGDPLGPWRGAPSLGTGSGRWAAAGTFASDRAYVSGGIVMSGGFTNTVLAARVADAPPALQGWQQVGTLPSEMADHGLVAIGSRLYVLGGSAAGDGGGVLLARTSMTSIGTDGTLGAWTAGGDLPRPVKAFGVVGADGRVFVIGGEDGPASTSASVFIGSPTATQELVWQETSPLANARRHLCTVRANGRLYAIGGGSISAVSPVVEVGDVSGTSVTWRETTAMPIARSALGCAAR